MGWKTRTLSKLRAAKAKKREAEAGLVVHVNAEEAVLLREAGADVTIASGFRNNEGRAFQVYSFQGKSYFWLAGHGSGTNHDSWPVRNTMGFALRGALDALMGI